MANTIFITGASTGLGRASAELFQSKGWRVAATMRKPESGTELAGLDGVEVFPLDVTDAAQIESSSKAAIEKFGAIDVLFNNAGYGLAGPHEALSDEQIDRQLQTNLLGVMRTTRAFLPHFRERKKGLVMTTTSIGGLIALPFFSAYHATKWALEGWSESLRFELAPLGIGVKTVSPGGINTDFATRSLEMASHPAYQESLSKVLAAFGDPKRALGASSPEQIAAVVYEAATDGKKTLRYVAGEDAKAMRGSRLEIGEQAFMDGIHSEFFGD